MANSIRELKGKTSGELETEGIIGIVSGVILITVGIILFIIYCFKDIKNCIGNCMGREQEGAATPLLNNEHGAE